MTIALIYYQQYVVSMDRIELMKTYLAVADAGSFTQAADKLNITPQLASKYIRALEDDLGSQLFNRSTRRVNLTHTGAAYYDRCARLIEDFDELTAAVRQDHQVPRGELRVTAPVDFGELHLIDALSDFADAFPDISINLTLTDRFLDMLEEGIDVAIRIGELESSSLIARRIGTAPIVFCASAEYLAHTPKPAHPGELSKHKCIVDTNFKLGSSWPFMVNGKLERISIVGRFRVNNASAARRLALNGHGITLVPSYIVSQDLKEGRLISVLEEFSASDLGIHAVYPEARHLSAKTRSFVDFVATRFRDLE